jgi:2'-5' RNA ligase
MRLFIAIEIDQKTRDAIGRLQQDIAARAQIDRKQVKWVKPASIHLTLKFLGEVKDERVNEICQAIEQVAARHKAFSLDIEGVGHFGRPAPRVLWVGTGSGTQPLRDLQADLEQTLDEIGWPPENREFSGHLTLARIKNKKAGHKILEITADDKYKDLHLETIAADAVKLYQSTLTPSGAEYTVLANYNLQ